MSQLLIIGTDRVAIAEPVNRDAVNDLPENLSARIPPSRFPKVIPKRTKPSKGSHNKVVRFKEFLFKEAYPDTTVHGTVYFRLKMKNWVHFYYDQSKDYYDGYLLYFLKYTKEDKVEIIKEMEMDDILDKKITNVKLKLVNTMSMIFPKIK